MSMIKTGEFFYNGRFYEIFASRSIDNQKVYKVLMTYGNLKKMRSFRETEINPVLIERKFIKK